MHRFHGRLESRPVEFAMTAEIAWISSLTGLRRDVAAPPPSARASPRANRARHSRNGARRMPCPRAQKFNHASKLDPKDREAAGSVTFGRVTLQPGWKWSTCVKPIAKTESCQALLPPGHDAWVVGDEPFVAIDIQGMTHYEEPPKKA